MAAAPPRRRSGNYKQWRQPRKTRTRTLRKDGVREEELNEREGWIGGGSRWGAIVEKNDDAMMMVMSNGE